MPPTKLHISPLPTPATALLDYFTRFGRPLSFSLPEPDALGGERGFGYLVVDFDDHEDEDEDDAGKGRGNAGRENKLDRCLRTVNGTIWRGIKLKVQRAKMGYLERIQLENLPPTLPTQPKGRTEKQLRSLKLKKRRERKRRINELGGVRSGDMRLVRVRDGGGAGSGTGMGMGKGRRLRKGWKEDTLSSRIVRPIFTRPTHPLPPAPIVTSAPNNSKPTSTSLKQKRHPRSRPPTRARRVWLDPIGFGSRHEVFSENEFEQGEDGVGGRREGLWVWEEVGDEADDADVGAGRWTFQPPSSHPNPNPDFDDLPTERIPGTKERTQSILRSIAETSLYPSTYEVYEPKSYTLALKSGSAGQQKAAQAQGQGQRKLKLRSLEEEVQGLDDDDIWGEMGFERDQGGLFDSREPVGGLEEGSGRVKHARERGQRDDPDADDEGLFDTQKDVEADQGSPLFTHSGNVLNPPSSPSPSSASGSGSGSDSARSDLFPPPARQAVIKGTNSLEQVVRREKRRELALLGSLGFSLDAADAEDDAAMKTETFEGESDESDWAPVMRLRGGAGESEGMQVDEESTSDGDDSTSDSDSDSDSDTSSASPSESSSEEESEDEIKVDVDPGQRALTKQETLKDLFKPRPDEGTGFSLMAGLDLDLDSDEEYESAPPQPTIPSPVPSFIPAPLTAVPVGGKNDLFAPEPGAPFFFYDSHQSMAPPGETYGADEMRKRWLGTVKTLQGETIEVKPFVRCETDEQMTQKWKDSKVEMTREWKKRHREAVKRVKRGMGSGGAGQGEAAE